jgi:hypothetical protein
MYLLSLRDVEHSCQPLETKFLSIKNDVIDIYYGRDGVDFIAWIASSH